MSRTTAQPSLGSLPVRWETLRNARTLPSVLVLAAVCVMATIVAPRIFSAGGLMAVSRSLVVIAILGIALMIVLGVGGMDLSVAGILEMSAATGLIVMHTVGGGTAVQVGVALAVGLTAGLVNGLLIAYGGLAPLLATLATSFVYLAVALWITQGVPVGDVSAGVQWFGGNLGTLPVAIVVLAVLTVVISVVTRYSPWYRRGLLIGANRRAAVLDGTPVRRTELLAYVVCGLLSAVAGLVVTGQLAAFASGQSGQLLLLALGVAIIGGTNLFGGRVSGLGTVAGAAILSLITVILALNYVGPEIQQVIQGAILVLAVCVAAREPAS